MQFYESVVSSEVASYMRCLLVWVIRISTRWLQHGGGISRQEEGLRYTHYYNMQTVQCNVLHVVLLWTMQLCCCDGVVMMLFYCQFYPVCRVNAVCLCGHVIISSLCGVFRGRLVPSNAVLHYCFSSVFCCVVLCIMLYSPTVILHCIALYSPTTILHRTPLYICTFNIVNLDRTEKIQMYDVH